MLICMGLFDLGFANMAYSGLEYRVKCLKDMPQGWAVAFGVARTNCHWENPSCECALYEHTEAICRWLYRFGNTEDLGRSPEKPATSEKRNE